MIFLFLSLVSVIYTWIILHTFNRLPYKWLCDYDAVFSAASENVQKLVSMRLYFFPVFLFTFLNIFFLFTSSFSPLIIFTGISMILLLIHISLSDIQYMIIPDQHILMIILLGFLNLNAHNIFSKLAGLTAGALPFFIILTAGIFLKKKEYIGFGDIKLMGALGFLLGYVEIFNIYLLSGLLSGTSFIILALLSFKEKNFKGFCLPFAPFITLSLFFCNFKQFV